MARSYRRSFITPNCAASDKAYKVLSHREERRAVRVALAQHTPLPAPKEFGNPWDAPKDGKRYLHRPIDSYLLRK